MTNSSPWYRWPIEIDGLPMKKLWIFPWQTVSHNQMVYSIPHKMFLQSTACQLHINLRTVQRRIEQCEPIPCQVNVFFVILTNNTLVMIIVHEMD